MLGVVLGGTLQLEGCFGFFLFNEFSLFLGVGVGFDSCGWVEPGSGSKRGERDCMSVHTVATRLRGRRGVVQGHAGGRVVMEEDSRESE